MISNYFLIRNVYNLVNLYLQTYIFSCIYNLNIQKQKLLILWFPELVFLEHIRRGGAAIMKYRVPTFASFAELFVQ